MKTNKHQNLTMYFIAAFAMVVISNSAFAFSKSGLLLRVEPCVWQIDSTIEQENLRYQRRQQEMLKELSSLERTKEILRNSVIQYAQYNPTDTLGIIERWLNEFRDVTKFSTDRIKPIEREVRIRAKTKYGNDRLVIHKLDMYCFDILLSNMTAEEYGRYVKDVQMLHRWLGTRASDKMYIHYKLGLKFSEEQTTEAFKKLMTK